MADNVTLNAATGTFDAATDEIGGKHFQRFKLDLGADGVSAPVEGTVPVSGTVSTGGLTDTQLRASAVPVTFSGSPTVTVGNASLAVTGTFFQATQPVSIAAPVAVTGTFWQATQPVSAASLPLPTGAATETTLAAMNAKLPAAGQAVMASSQPVVIASNQTAVPIVESAVNVTGQSAQTATVNNILTATSGTAATDLADYRSASVQVVSTGTAGTFIFEQSNDNVNFVALPVFNAALVTGVPITAAITASASQIIYTFPIRARYVRLRIATTITGGSIQAFSRFSTEPWTAAAQLVASNTAANLNATVSGTVTANIGTGALAAGTAAIGDVGIQYRASATGAATVTNVTSPATPVGQTIKGSAGRLLGFTLVNTNAAARWLKVFNQTAVTPGTTSATFEIALPPNQVVSVKFEGGLAFGTGIMTMITAAQGLTNNGAITANDVTGFTAHV